MNPTAEPCHLCDRFRIKKTSAPGYGTCHGFDMQRRYDDTNAACVLWNRARDEARRREWAGRQTTQQENT